MSLLSSEVKTSNAALCRIWERKQTSSFQIVDNCAFHYSEDSGYKHPYLIFVTSFTSGACGEQLCHVDTNSYWEIYTFWWKLYILVNKFVYFSEMKNTFSMFFWCGKKFNRKNGLWRKITNMRYALCKQPPHWWWSSPVECWLQRRLQ